MLTISILCVGGLKESYLRQAAAEYAKRLSAFCRLQIIEIPEERLPDKPSPKEIEACLDKEGKRLLAKIPSGAKTTALCIEGGQVSSEELARDFSDVAVGGVSHLCFVIGGSYGLSEEVKQTAAKKLSMSKMTFPHQLARVMLLEQVYRAFQISSGGKYHK